MAPKTPITPVMAGLSAALNLLRTPRSPSSGHVELSLKEDEPLVAGSGLASEKCELRIEGMTCGACVEVCITRTRGLLRAQPTDSQ